MKRLPSATPTSLSHGRYDASAASLPTREATGVGSSEQLRATIPDILARLGCMFWNDAQVSDNSVQREPFLPAIAFVWLAALVASFGLAFTAQTGYQRLMISVILGCGAVLGLFTFSAAGFRKAVKSTTKPPSAALSFGPTLIGLAIMFGSRFLVVPDSHTGTLWPGVAGALAGFVLAVPTVWWLRFYLRRRTTRTQ